jgi:hypothetical protein
MTGVAWTHPEFADTAGGCEGAATAGRAVIRWPNPASAMATAATALAATATAATVGARHRRAPPPVIGASRTHPAAGCR